MAEYARNHPENPYIGVAGIWNAQKQHYEYRSYPLEFPQNITDSSGGDLMYYQYRLQSEDGGAARVMAALVPEGTAGVVMMARWLHGADRKFETEGWAGASYAAKLNHRKLKGGSGQSVSSGDPSCYYIWNFPNGNTLIEEGSCITVTAEPEPMVQEPPHNEAPTGGWENDDPEDGYPGETGGGSDSSNQVEAIIDIDLDPCMQDELDRLVTIGEGAGQIMQDFAVDQLDPGDLGNMNWTVKDKPLDDANAETETEYDKSTKNITTYFDSRKFGQATDLSVARTILHEAVHAYVISVMFNTIENEDLREELLGKNWLNAYENQGHDFIASDYVNDIADALEEFGTQKGYTDSRTFYEDLSWGGLESTPEFESKSASDKNRIKDVISIEQYGHDRDNDWANQQGDDSGC